MIAATSGPSFAFKAPRSTEPLAFAEIGSTVKPQVAAEAGFVPCADSGTSTRLRRSPRASSAARMDIIPQISPCAPAAELIAIAGIPVRVLSQ